MPRRDSWSTPRPEGGEMSPAPSEGLRPGLGRTAPRRKVWNAVMIGACYMAAAVVVLPLGLIVAHLLTKGAAALNWAFFFHMPKPVGEAGGGMANAIVGTLIMVGLGSLLAVPV